MILIFLLFIFFASIFILVNNLELISKHDPLYHKFKSNNYNAQYSLSNNDNNNNNNNKNNVMSELYLVSYNTGVNIRNQDHEIITILPFGTLVKTISISSTASPPLKELYMTFPLKGYIDINALTKIEFNYYKASNDDNNKDLKCSDEKFIMKDIDITRSNLFASQSIHVKNYQECCELCSKAKFNHNDVCGGWTFIQKTRDCWLKEMKNYDEKSLIKLKPNSGIITGLNDNNNNNNNDIQNSKKPHKLTRANQIQILSDLYTKKDLSCCSKKNSNNPNTISWKNLEDGSYSTLSSSNSADSFSVLKQKRLNYEWVSIL